MISHSPVVVSAGKTKYSPTPGQRLKHTARVLCARRHPRHVGECERAHRLVERGALGVALEEAGDLALAGCDDDQVGRVRVALEVGDGRVVEHELARRSTRSAAASAGT